MCKRILILVGLLILISTWTYAKVPKSRHLQFDYEVYLRDIPPAASKLSVWVPLLPENDYQKIDEISIDPRESSEINEDHLYKNKILHFELKPPFDSSYKLTVHYKLKRLEYINRPGSGGNGPTKRENGDELSKFLRANRLVTLSPKVKTIAQEITKGKKTTIEKARAIYNFIFDNVSYDKTIPGWGNGDTERVCNLKAGNCTDFHSLFISLARANNIPAKFVIGIPLKNKDQGEYDSYHCWAEFYDEQLGWIPVDVSEAWKDKSRYEYYFGTIGENRLEFSQGRDIVLEPKQAGEPLNYFFYPYAEVDGQIHKGIGVLFKYQNVSDDKI